MAASTPPRELTSATVDLTALLAGSGAADADASTPVSAAALRAYAAAKARAADGARAASRADAARAAELQQWAQRVAALSPGALSLLLAATPGLRAPLSPASPASVSPFGAMRAFDEATLAAARKEARRLLARVAPPPAPWLLRAPVAAAPASAPAKAAAPLRPWVDRYTSPSVRRRVEQQAAAAPVARASPTRSARSAPVTPVRLSWGWTPAPSALPRGASPTPQRRAASSMQAAQQLPSRERATELLSARRAARTAAAHERADIAAQRYA
jgi:hypothetical protein